MGKEPRLSSQTLSVLSALISRPTDELSGAEIAKRTKLASGSLYPILFRLEEAGWLESRWEDGDPTTLGRPRRRFYKITAEGARKVRALAQNLTPTEGSLAWSS